MNIGHVNARSWFKKMDETFSVMEGVDILGISETWLNSTHSDAQVSVDGYGTIRSDRNVKRLDTHGNKKGGGLILYIKQKFWHHATEITEITSCTSDLEQLWVNICKPGNKRLIVGLCYRPPSGDVNVFHRELCDSYEHVLGHARTPEVVIMGDFNINYAEKKTSNFEKLSVLESKYNLKQLIKKPTRVTYHSRSIIDLIFTNIVCISKSGVIDHPIADHLPVYLVKKRPRENKASHFITRRNFKNYDREKFTKAVSNHWKWNEFWMVTSDPETLWDIMIGIIISVADTMYPIEKLKVRDVKPYWMNDYLIKCLNKKRLAYATATRTGKVADWDIFKKLRATVKRLFRRQKMTYISRKLGSRRHDPKKFWREMGRNLRLGKHGPRKGLFHIVGDEGELLDGKSAANHMNRYYTSVGEKLSVNFKENWVRNGFFDELNKIEFSFNFITENVIKNILKTLPLNKSSCTEFITSRVLRDSMLEMLTETTFMINECIRCEVMPTKWKVGYVTPMPKGKSVKNPSDWRPVSVLPLPSKVIERAVYNQLVYHFECNNYLCRNQHGFRREHSTASAIFEYVQFLYDNFDKLNSTSSIFVDYSKAFDTIDHEILIKKLLLYKFDKKSVKWFTNYLSGRTQMVKLENGIISTSLGIKMGVPQGSILGPFLFLIYINDLIYTLRNCDSHITLYADDTILYSADSDMYQACAKNHETLILLYEWCNLNRLTINVSKTKHMVVQKDMLTDIDIPILKANNMEIGNVHKYNYLGVIVDDKLIFDEFLESKYNTINMRILQLMRMRQYITSDTALTIYKQMIIPLFDYADFMVESAPKPSIAKLEKLQEKALKCIENECQKKVDVDLLYGKYGIQHLCLRYREHISCFMYRQSKKPGMLDLDRPTINLRSNKKVKFKKKSKYRYTIYLKSPKVRGMKVWNMLPANVQKATTKVKFKCLIKKICKMP